MGLNIADRKDECAFFKKVIGGSFPKRIYLLDGPSESGKTVLLAELSEITLATLPACRHVTLHLENWKLPGIVDIFYKKIGAKFSSRPAPETNPAQPQSIIKAEFSGATIGDNNRITITSESSAQAQEELRQALTKVDQSVVIILDGFDKAIKDVRDWILTDLFTSAVENSNIVVVVAGKRLPDPQKHPLEWGKKAELHLLELVTSKDDWHELAQSRHPAFPRSFIDWLCDGPVGQRPSMIMSYIELGVKKLKAGIKLEVLP